MNRQILLVEDSLTDEKLTMRAINKADVGAIIQVVRDGAEALEYLFRTGKFGQRDVHIEPALILLDLKLPRVDGLEVLRRTRASPLTRLLPVVIMTASGQEDDVVAAYSLGANGYVRKPVDFPIFVSNTRTLLHFWLKINEAAPPQRGS